MHKQDKWDPKKYKKHSDPQQEGAAAIVKELVLRSDEKVLDIGCGDGRITVEIAKKIPNGKIIGIDPSKNMIAEAQKTFAHVKNVSFVEGKAENFTFDFQFDLIVSFSALHYVSDHLGVLKKIYNHLKSGGTFIAWMAAGDTPQVAQVFHKEPWKSLMKEREENWHAKTEDEYKPLLEQAGFKNNIVETRWGITPFETKDDIFNWAIAWVPYVTGFDQETAKKFARDLVENIVQGKEKNIEMKTPLLYVKAVKS